jgi:acetyl esterase
MRKSITLLLVVIGFVFATHSLARAQVANMPRHVQDLLAEVGPVWGKDILGNNAKMLEVYTPILRGAPQASVRVVRDLSYGPDARHKLDLYKAEGKSSVPIVVYLHGGAYVRGERNINNEVYANVAKYFARQGMLGVNATYRLAPSAQWPAAAEDVAALVKWLKANASIYGGDGSRIYLYGHSAGATHVASYVYIRSLQPAEGPGIAGIILSSGRYHFDPKPDDPNLKNFQAYFGTDAAQYPVRSPINHIKTAAPIPTFIVIAEYDNPDLDTQGALLFAALCERDRACPRFKRLEWHNHLSMVYHFNTADDALGREIIEFMRRGR